MQNEKTKALLVNILTWAVILGVLVAGYFVFLNQTSTPTGTTAVSTGVSSIDTSVSQVASKTAIMGNEISATISDLQNLQRAVAGATIIFSLPTFMNLEDFSVPIPIEKTGRPNPFIPTDWKLKMQASQSDSANPGSSVSATPYVASQQSMGPSLDSSTFAPVAPSSTSTVVSTGLPVDTPSTGM